MLRSRLFLAPFALVFASPADAQDVLYRFDADQIPTAIVPFLTAPGDVDGDGRPDISVGGLAAVGADAFLMLSGRDGTTTATKKIEGPTFAFPVTAVDLDGDGIVELITSTAFYSSGIVRIHDGVDGPVDVEIGPPAESQSFGGVVTVVGDLDLDGVRDLAISAPSDSVHLDHSLFGNVGRVFFHSGRDGSLIHEVVPTEVEQSFGIAVARLGDADGDGVDDVVVGSSTGAWVLSGADATVIHAFEPSDHGVPLNAHFGSAVANAGDIDGDGRDDVLIGAPGINLFSTQGRVFLYSGSTGELLVQVAGQTDDRFGVSMAGTADIDGDGTRDFVVGASQRDNAWQFSGPGFVRAFSGASGASLFTVYGATDGSAFGQEVVDLGDVNADGASDFAVLEADSLLSPPIPPAVTVFSGRPLALTADEHLVSLATGGGQSLEVRFGAAMANATYLVLGSISGTEPGVVVAGQPVLLNPDAWFLFTAGNPNSVVLPGSFGLLDADGRASAAIAIPPVAEPALVGLRFDHAAIAIDGSAVVAASNAVPLTLVE